MTNALQQIIESAWELRTDAQALARSEVRDAVEHTIAELDSGRLRVSGRSISGSRRPCC
jgi:2,3,4,5-tetrahydropyridine-2-carboxylate N-succinyltransferase